MIDLTTAILAINSDAEVSIKDNDIEKISWLKGTKEISKDDIQSKQTELQVIQDTNAYQKKRAAEYKPLAEQLDMQYHDVQDGTETWLDHIKEVKAKYPKGDE